MSVSKQPPTKSISCQTDANVESTGLGKQHSKTRSTTAKTTNQPSTSSNSKDKPSGKHSNKKSYPDVSNRSKRGSNPINLQNKYSNLDDEAKDDMDIYYTESQHVTTDSKSRTRSRSPRMKCCSLIYN